MVGERVWKMTTCVVVYIIVLDIYIIKFKFATRNPERFRIYYDTTSSFVLLSVGLH